MPLHATKIEFCHRCIQTLKPRGFPKLDAPRLNYLSNMLYLCVVGYPLVVIITFVNPPCIGAYKTPLEFLQLRFAANKAKQNRFKARCAGIVFLIRVRGEVMTASIECGSRICRICRASA